MTHTDKVELAQTIAGKVLLVISPYLTTRQKVMMLLGGEILVLLEGAVYTGAGRKEAPWNAWGTPLREKDNVSSQSDSLVSSKPA